MRSSKMPRTICRSRGDNANERAISVHACSLNIAEPNACRRERAFCPRLSRLFTIPSLTTLWRDSPSIVHALRCILARSGGKASLLGWELTGGGREALRPDLGVGVNCNQGRENSKSECRNSERRVDCAHSRSLRPAARTVCVRLGATLAPRLDDGSGGGIRLRRDFGGQEGVNVAGYGDELVTLPGAESNFISGLAQ